MACTVTRFRRHVKSTPITAEDSLRNEMSKTNLPETIGKFNELLHHFAEQNDDIESNRKKNPHQ